MGLGLVLGGRRGRGGGELSGGLLDPPVFLHKVVDELGSVLVFQLLTGDSNCVQELLPLWLDVAALFKTQGRKELH